MESVLDELCSLAERAPMYVFTKRSRTMATKTDFTSQEWETLRDAPHLVMLAVATAGASGPIGSLKEVFAASGVVAKAAKGNNELLKSLCDREELKASEHSLRSAIK